MATIQTALAHHQAGRLPEAEALYRQILASDPHQVDAWHLLGLIAHERHDHEAAEELIGRALALAGDRAAFHSNLGEVYRARGKLAEAERSLRRALELDPQSPTALNNLGIVLGAQGMPAEASEAFQRAIRARADFAEPHNNLGTLLQAAGQLDEAIAHYRQAVRINPAYAAAFNNLGTALKARWLLDEAAEAYRHALGLAPQNGDVHLNLGTVYQLRRQFDAAIACYREALRLDPESALAHNNLGTALRDQGRVDEAIASLREALALDPQSADAHCNLGLASYAKKDFAAAAESFRQALHANPRHANALAGFGKLAEDEGRLDDAVAWYDQAIAAEPKLALAHVFRADVSKAQGRIRDAVAGYETALAVNPRCAEAYNNLAVLYTELGQPDQAVDCCRQVLAGAPDAAALHGNLATALGQRGQLDEALAASRTAVALRPESPGEFTNLLYGLNYVPGYDPATHFAEHLEWARRHAEPLTAVAQPHANDPVPDRRLRVGYVSPYFCEHAVNFFSEPLIAAHDHGDFEIFCYSDVRRADAATRRLQSAADHWRDVRYKSDEQLAELVRGDAVDVLVDLTGHIAGNRLLTFARKPAPVQVTYIGYQNTTGMSAMDYRLTDERADPPGHSERYYTEKLVRLPRAFFCYRPADDVPPVTPLPARESGYVTFGSFNNFNKVTPPATRAWLEILKRVPTARLAVLAYRGGELERRLREAARRHGVDPERIEMSDKRPRADYYRLVQHSDVALDPFPFNGHTTTCDAIWLGLPVVMLLGQTYASRFGSSVLANVGLDDLVAKSVDEYVERAVALAGDLDRLDELRSQLRPRMAESPLLDYRGFARNVEAAYRHMWRDWCAGSKNQGG